MICTEHLRTYPNYIQNGGIYQIPKDQYDRIQYYLSIPESVANKMPTSTGEFSLRQWREVHEFFNTGKVPPQQLEPSILEYGKVQAGTVQTTFNQETERLTERDQVKRDAAYQKSKPTLSEGVKVTVVSAAIEGGTVFCMSIIRKRKNGKKLKEFDKDDWNEIVGDTGTGTAKGTVRGASISPVTYEGYTNMIKGRIRRFFDPLGVTIGSLTPQLIEDFLDSITDDGCNSSTQLRYYQIIGNCLKSAVRKDHIDRNPIEKVDRPRRAKFTAAYYSKDEALHLLECAKGETCYIPVLLGLFYGMRRSEATGLQWSSVDFENNQIHIDHKAYVESLKGKARVCITDVMKTDASKRTLPLIPQVREELLKHKARQEEYRRSFGRSYNKE